MFSLVSPSKSSLAYKEVPLDWVTFTSTPPLSRILISIKNDTEQSLKITWCFLYKDGDAKYQPGDSLTKEYPPGSLNRFTYNDIPKKYRSVTGYIGRLYSIKINGVKIPLEKEDPTDFKHPDLPASIVVFEK